MFKRIKAYIRLFRRINAMKKRIALMDRLDEIDHLLYCQVSSVPTLCIEKSNILRRLRGQGSGHAASCVPVFDNILSA